MQNKTPLWGPSYSKRIFFGKCPAFFAEIVELEAAA
jgi:hypothetical protein